MSKGLAVEATTSQASIREMAVRQTTPKFGIQFRNFPFELRGVLFESVDNVAKAAERLSYDSLWMIDHLMLSPPIAYESQPIPDCWSVLSFLAATTSRVKIGSLVSCVSFRDQANLARTCFTVDEISNGRLMIGLGTGWFEQEFRAYGIAYPTLAERIRSLERTSKFLRYFFQTVGSDNDEDAVSKKAPPEIWIGGSGEKFTLRSVARYGDACSLFGDPVAVGRKISILNEMCGKLGRQSSEITKSKHSNVLIGSSRSEVDRKMRLLIPDESKWKTFVSSNVVGTPDECVEQVCRYLASGVDYFTLSFPDVFEIDSLRTFESEVIRPVREQVSAR